MCDTVNEHIYVVFPVCYNRTFILDKCLTFTRCILLLFKVVYSYIYFSISYYGSIHITDVGYKIDETFYNHTKCIFDMTEDSNLFNIIKIKPGSCMQMSCLAIM